MNIKWDNEFHFKEKKLIRKDYSIYISYNVIKDIYEIKTSYNELSWKHKEIDKYGLNKKQFEKICLSLKIKI